jgi:hypothetical protein
MGVVRALRIDAVILHGIQKRTRGEEVEPDLSDAASDLSPRIRVFLQEQVAQALKHGRQIVEEPGFSEVPDVLRGFWDGESLLDSSRVLARRLQSSQPTQSPEGLLMVADATADGQRVFVIAKLEHEKGAQAKREPDEQGRLVYSMNFLDDLFFTTGSKVYKIGFFPIGDDPAGPISGLVVDRQAAGHAVARYFRENYLGCVWRERPELATERFMNTVQDWIDALDDPEKRARYQVALISELQNQHTGLSVGTFAAQNLDADDRDDFQRHARQTLPATEIPKDVELVRARLANVRIDTRSGTILMAPPESMRDGTVTVEQDPDDEKSRITVHDEISGTSGTGTYKPPA